MALTVVGKLGGTVSPIASFPRASELVLMTRWSDDGKSIVCRRLDRKSRKWSTIAVGLDGKTRELDTSAEVDMLASPDGTHRVEPNGPGITVKELATGKKTQVIGKIPAQYANWSPDSAMIAFNRPTELKDDHAERTAQVTSLWLAAAEDHPLNHLCIAYDAREWNGPSSWIWSADSLRVAYISAGKGYIAELTVRDPSLDEKARAGMPLSDEELQELMSANAKQLGAAMRMFSQDNDGNFPSDEATAQKSLDPYVADNNIYFRPGTKQNAFRLTFYGNASSLSNPSETVAGIIDGGRGWLIHIYADGHVKVVPRR